MIIEIIAKESGERIDALLARSIEGLTRSRAQKLIETGLVTKNGLPLIKSAKTSDGDVFEVIVPSEKEKQLCAEPIDLDIVYEDADVIVINKPRGMVVHPSPGHEDGTLVNALMHHCGEELSKIGGEGRPGIVHRIDKDSSGLILAAKNDAAHLKLAAQLKDHSLCRRYEAVVCGGFRNESGTVDAPIGRHPVERKKMAVIETGRPATTHYNVIARYSGFTHIACELETGRTHQIRVHMAHIKHPLLGDTVYGRGREKGLSGQCLHARELRFVHPTTGEKVVVEAHLPEYFLSVLSRLGPKLGE